MFCLLWFTAFSGFDHTSEDKERNDKRSKINLDDIVSEKTSKGEYMNQKD